MSLSTHFSNMFVPHLIPEASAQTHWHFPAQWRRCHTGRCSTEQGADRQPRAHGSHLELRPTPG